MNPLRVSGEISRCVGLPLLCAGGICKFTVGKLGCELVLVFFEQGLGTLKAFMAVPTETALAGLDIKPNDRSLVDSGIMLFIGLGEVAELVERVGPGG